MPMTCKPVGWTVLIEELKRDDIGGIIIPDAAKELSVIHIVRDVGDPHVTANGREIPIPVKVGDQVRFNTDLGPRIITRLDPQLFGGRILAILDCDAIKGVFSGEPEKVIVASKPTPRNVLVH